MPAGWKGQAALAGVEASPRELRLPVGRCVLLWGIGLILQIGPVAGGPMDIGDNIYLCLLVGVALLTPGPSPTLATWR